ncbi:MAG TPA: PLP-dependent transferase [Candidatus Acidoferrales bacterium]
METTARTRRGKKSDYRMRTHLIHGNFESKRWDYDHHVIPPISSSTTFRLSSVERAARGFSEFPSAVLDPGVKHPIYVYDRYDEPTRGMLEENLAYAEGGDCAVAFSSGMAAISAALGIHISAGDHILAHRMLYGGTHNLLRLWMPRFRVAVDYCDLLHPTQLRKLIAPRTRVVYFETPINPTMELIDISAVRKVVDEFNSKRPPDRHISTIVDNTFATPFCQRPLQLGADLVVHSLTKNIGGFGTDMGGVVIGGTPFYVPLMQYRRDFGGVLSPKAAWAFLVYGLPTLAARIVNQQKTAMRVAEFLKSHPKIARVVYPGLDCFPQRDLARRQMVSYDGKFAPGHMLYFVLKGDHETARKAADGFANHVAQFSYCMTLAVSLGQIKTLVEIPFSMTHSGLSAEEKLQTGTDPGGIRISFGLEDWHDIIEDIRTALDHIC